MIAAFEGWLTPTRTVGMASFGCAAVASALAWNRTVRHWTASMRKTGSPMSTRRLLRFSSISRLPMMLTLIHSTLFLDMAFDLRWRLHGLLMNAAIDERVYGQRRLPQVVVLDILALVLAMVCFSVIRSYWRSKAALLALMGTVIGIASWCLEVISLHQVDAVLYETKGPFMAVAAIWILAGLMTTTGITAYAKADAQR